MKTHTFTAMALLLCSLFAPTGADAGYTITDLGPGIGHGINASGQVVGRLNTTTGYQAFLYSGGVTTDLGTLGGSYSDAHGINASGQVVGRSFLAGDSVLHAFLYLGGVMTDLGTLGGTLSLNQA